MSAPLRFRWTGAVMAPLAPAHAKTVYRVDQTYALAEAEQRSTKSHSHYFAVINEGWSTLPEHEAIRFPTADHLRYYLLIKAGHYTERQLVLGSKAEAERVAAFMRGKGDDYTLVVPRERVVTEFTAKSQSLAAMGKADFQASKTKVLDLLAEMLGIDRTTLEANTGRSA